MQNISELIREYQNPYPQDIFRWDNKEKLNFNRGRFNKFIFNVVENIKKDIIKLIEEESKQNVKPGTTK